MRVLFFFQNVIIPPQPLLLFAFYVINAVAEPVLLHPQGQMQTSVCVFFPFHDYLLQQERGRAAAAAAARRTDGPVISPAGAISKEHQCARGRRLIPQVQPRRHVAPCLLWNPLKAPQSSAVLHDQHHSRCEGPQHTRSLRSGSAPIVKK